MSGHWQPLLLDASPREHHLLKKMQGQHGRKYMMHQEFHQEVSTARQELTACPLGPSQIGGRTRIQIDGGTTENRVTSNLRFRAYALNELYSLLSLWYRRNRREQKKKKKRFCFKVPIWLYIEFWNETLSWLTTSATECKKTTTTTTFLVRLSHVAVFVTVWRQVRAHVARGKSSERQRWVIDSCDISTSYRSVNSRSANRCSRNSFHKINIGVW